MNEENCVVGLRRLGDKIKKHRLITLNGHEEVTIGRSPNVTVSFLSPMISRCHAVLKKQEAEWTIKDNKSLNGVTVNGQRLDPEKPHTLQEGDVVQFGVPPEGDKQEEFIFQYHKRIKVKRARPKSVDDETDSAAHSSPSPSKYSLKRVRLEQDSAKNQTPKNGEQSNDAWSPFQRYKEKVAEKDLEAEKKLKEVEAKLAEMQEMLKQKEKAQEEMKIKLEEERKQRENQSMAMKEKLKEKEKELEIQTCQMKVKLKEKEEELERELRKKQEDEERMREELEAQLQNREAALKEQLQAQKEGLIKEKERIEQTLQESMAKALEEKDKKLEEELLQTKQKLEMVIQQKETEQKMLESQLNETKEEKELQKEAMLHARQDILANFADLMETELQCSICNELYVQATSLNCSHSFCSLCISQWMKVKKECPICRTPISSHMRSIALDNYIDTMVEHLSDELKDRRKKLVADRKAEQDAADAANKPTTSSTASPAPGRGRGRGRGRGGRGGRRGGNNNRTIQQNQQGHRPIIVEEEPDPIEVSSDLEMSDSDGDSLDSEDDTGRDSMDSEAESDDYIPGEPGAYYGGYGSCYRCGSRGHWANGCPFR